MSINEATLKQQITEMEDKLQQMRQELESPKQWEPEGGDWLISMQGVVIDKSPSAYADWTTLGVKRPTHQQALRAATAMREHDRLLAYVDEHAPDYVADWSNSDGKWYVYYDCHVHKYTMQSNTYANILGAVYMPRSVATTLCNRLNSGEVVL
jgi:hypothetical protein